MEEIPESGLRVSWSRMKESEICKQKGYRKSRGQSSPIVDGRVFLPGTLADRCMRYWLEEEDPQPGGMFKYLDESFEEHTGPDAQYVIRWKNNSKANDAEHVKMFVTKVLLELEPILFDLVIPFRYQPEARIQAPIVIPDLEGNPIKITLIGGLDIVVQDDDDNFGVYDLKATTNDAYVKGPIMGQLPFYSVLWGSYIGDRNQPKWSAFITPACKEKVVRLDISPEDRRDILKRIVTYAHGVWRKDWTPTESDAPCWNCECRVACSKWAVPQKTDDAGVNRASFAEAAAKRKVS